MATRKLTVTIPEDLAAKLEGLPNVSAYVTEAIRHRSRVDEIDEMLAERGITVTAEGVEKMTQRIYGRKRARPLGSGPLGDQLAA